MKKQVLLTVKELFYLMQHVESPPIESDPGTNFPKAYELDVLYPFPLQILEAGGIGILLK